MATELVPHIWDDLALREDPQRKIPADITMRFSVEGSGDREIDVNADNAIAFRSAIEPFLAASRPARPAPPKVRRVNRGPNGTYFSDLRTWAGEQGIEVKSYNSPSGKKAGFKYPVALRQKYDAWLASQRTPVQ